MSKIKIGVNYLHSHPYMEKEHNVDDKHTIVDKSDLQEIVAFFDRNQDAKEQFLEFKATQIPQGKYSEVLIHKGNTNE